ncbi:hypothetical protein LUD75_10200 [Epilithonimonas sp. JDS]|uniref:hypothetical protein n=1 Tax=Epilithonimonas sp. JDS TaxID=2902797 RepID=UPI001E2BF6AC|nr:hypothetical protein [Epilithonimonas sp. JDS]MCD9855080.1 hypothetical protein [Epilithonimonas sp. JDS]
MNFKNIFSEIINSENFKEKLEKINQNYPNLKQENFIRNVFLEIINESYSNSERRAFAEHPRENGRTDLSIVNIADQSIFKVELKFQFTKDDNHFQNYNRVVVKDFETKNSDLFILIVCSFDVESKREFDQTWGISSNLLRFHSSEEIWKQNIKVCFDGFLEISNLQEYEITVSTPYQTNYNFYLLERNIDIN